jgi:Sec-independent protein secretion pathway component TatC
VPFVILYEIGIIVARIFGKPRDPVAEQEAEENATS